LVHVEPTVTFFKPRGIPLIDLEEVSLTVDELETVSLKDLRSLDQEHGAVAMNVSQPTFHRIIESAHRKIADALVNGKAVKIEGGNYAVRGTGRLFICDNCANEWIEPYGTPSPSRCPKCTGTKVRRALGNSRHERRRRRGKG
jgi:predicted DNA-binding protein (UPF0251 family)